MSMKKDQVVPAGTGAVAGGAAGAALGAVIAGPAGLAVGAVAGGALGALLGDRAGQASDDDGALGHFQQIHDKMPYHVDGMAWEDYAPAYRYGLQSYALREGRDFDRAEAALQSRWEDERGPSRLTWAQARGAVEHVWRELSQAANAATSPP